MGSHSEVVLFAVVGMSPAVLTETVWALAHEKLSVVPDRVVVLTTTYARDQIKKVLFAPDDKGVTGWQSLLNALNSAGFDTAGKLKFGLTGDSIRVFTDSSGDKELADIATSKDNEAAADFMLRVLRSFTSNPNTTVIASIAGGRKTMSALMISCISLLGREQDRVCHVLVNPPFDSSLTPPFLFPVKGLKHKDRDEKPHSSLKANIELTDVPFVRMLGWYADKFKNDPPKYSRLVAGVQKQVPKVYPKITLDMVRCRVTLNKNEVVELSSTEFMLLYTLCHKDVSNHSDITKIMHKYKAVKSDNLQDYYVKFIESSRFNDDDDLDEIRKTLSSLRKKFIGRISKSLAEDLVPKRNKSQIYPKSKIKIKGRNPFER